MSGWVIATVILACLLAFSLLAIIINGIEDKWRVDQFVTVFIFIFFLPIVFPLFIWNAVRERKRKKSEKATGAENAPTDNEFGGKTLS